MSLPGIRKCHCPFFARTLSGASNRPSCRRGVSERMKIAGEKKVEENKKNRKHKVHYTAILKTRLCKFIDDRNELILLFSWPVFISALARDNEPAEDINPEMTLIFFW